MNLSHNIEPSILVQSSNIDLMLWKDSRSASTKAFRELLGQIQWAMNYRGSVSLAPLCVSGLPAGTSIRCSSGEKERSSRCYGLFHGVCIDGLQTERRTHGEAQVTGRVCVSASILEADTVGLMSEVLSCEWCEEKLTIQQWNLHLQLYSGALLIIWSSFSEHETTNKCSF